MSTGHHSLCELRTNAYLWQLHSLLPRPPSRSHLSPVHRRTGSNPFVSFSRISENFGPVSTASLVTSGVVLTRKEHREWWDANEKMKFMDGYGIAVSVQLFSTFSRSALESAADTSSKKVVSPPTPSVNFLPPSEAIKAATTLNDELATYCSASPSLYALAVLPLAPGVSLASVVNELDRIRNIDKFKGVMIGTRGFATGLDDEVMMGVWEALATKGVVAFIVSLFFDHSQKTSDCLDYFAFFNSTQKAASVARMETAVQSFQLHSVIPLKSPWSVFLLLFLCKVYHS